MTYKKGDNYKHGDTIGRTYAPEYKSWRSMIVRCERVGSGSYARYGAVGISVCKRWRESYALFLADMGRMPGAGYSIDRFDSKKSYAPGNCRWATRKEQARNKRNNVRIEVDGVALTAPEWTERTGIPKKVIWQRLNLLGWPPEKAVSYPLRKSSR